MTSTFQEQKDKFLKDIKEFGIETCIVGHENPIERRLDFRVIIEENDAPLTAWFEFDKTILSNGSETLEVKNFKLVPQLTAYLCITY